MAFEMVNQEAVLNLDKEVDVAIHAMILAEGDDWRGHVEGVQKLLKQRVELTRPEVFGEIQELLRKRG